MPHPNRPRRLARRSHVGAAALVVLAAAAALNGATTVRAATGFTAAAPLTGLGGGRVWSVAVSPATPSTILAGTDHGLYVSRDSGASWRITLPAEQVWTVGFDLRNAQNAFAGTNGQGVFASGDAGSTWGPASQGLQNRDVRALAFGLDGVAAGTASGVALSPDGHTWHDAGLDGSSISALAVAANAPQLVLIAGTDNTNPGGGFLFRSAAGGAWPALQSGLPTAAVVSSIASGPIDAAVPQHPLLATTSKGTYRSGDGGTTWTSSGGIPDTLTVTTAVYSPLDPSLVYAGADAGGSTGGDMLRSTDGGMTFGVFDAGLPSASKNVETIGLGPTNPLTVVAGLDPPGGGALIFTLADSTAPAAPQLTPEAPGAPVTTAVATPTPSPSATPKPATTTPVAPPQSGIQRFAAAAFHWPFPLVYEIVFVLFAVYVFVRWRQRSYVEGPP